MTQDFLLCTSAISFAGLGMLLIALSGTSRTCFGMSLVVFAFGIGFADAMKSLATKLILEKKEGCEDDVEEEEGCDRVREVKMLYLSIEYVQALANMINGPAWAGIYSLVLNTASQASSGPGVEAQFQEKKGGAGNWKMAVPWIFASGLMFGTLGLVIFLKVKRRTEIGI
ncbi:hypothetical protein G7Y89_g3477 [Cudoniella acicularis]|uniref:Uncharacterized protein n=1 Tax=Cudoniella acicularis TaxID=354080 RepID=A0A8H4RSK5_9HELO|nr:hypothetical protein G7Y89_g3477 [Cudoniella acicularis]